MFSLHTSFEVLFYVFDIFQTNSNPNKTIGNASLLPLLGPQPAAAGRGAGVPEAPPPLRQRPDAHAVPRIGWLWS